MSVEVPDGAEIYRDEFFFDIAAANHAVRFFEEYLVHSKGEWAGSRFILADWQRPIVEALHGWKRLSDGTRRYREAYIEVPRKNGKSTWVAGEGLYLLTADGEPGAEVYSAAGDRDQALIVFKEAAEMARSCPELAEICDIQTKAIVVPSTVSVYRVLSSEAFTKHGFNPHGVLFDELHAQPNRDLWDVLTTGFASRRQPLTLAATTAGHDLESICYQKHDYAEKVRDGIIDDPEFLPVIYAASKDDDWKDPAVWAKANPNLGVSVKMDFLERECKKASESPAYENVFKRLFLNIWTEQETRWIPVSEWDANDKAVAFENELRGRPFYVGLDLSQTTDITAAVRVYPRADGTFDIIPRFYVPKENADRRARKDRVPYPTWIQQGFITATPGNVIDYEYIKNDVVEWSKSGQLREVAYDPWNATQIALQLEGVGLKCTPIRQGFASLTGPTKAFEGCVLSRRFRYAKNPVLRWMFSNIAIEIDAAGNIKVSKKKSREKIDGIVAIINALARATLSVGDGNSVYQKRGMISV